MRAILRELREASELYGSPIILLINSQAATFRKLDRRGPETKDYGLEWCRPIIVYHSLQVQWLGQNQ